MSKTRKLNEHIEVYTSETPIPAIGLLVKDSEEGSVFDIIDEDKVYIRLTKKTALELARVLIEFGGTDSCLSNS